MDHRLDIETPANLEVCQSRCLEERQKNITGGAFAYIAAVISVGTYKGHGGSTHRPPRNPMLLVALIAKTCDRSPSI